MSTGNMTKLMRKVQFVDNSPDPENVNPDETFGHIEYVWNTIAQSLLEFSKNLEIDLDTNILTIKDANCNSTKRIEAFMEFIDATDDVIKLSISQLSEAIAPFSNVYQFTFKSSNQSIYRLVEVADIIQLINIAINAQFQTLTAHCEKLKQENDQIYKDYANEVSTGIFLEQKISSLNQEITNCRALITHELTKSNADTNSQYESQSLTQLVSSIIQCSHESNMKINQELSTNQKKIEDLTKEFENSQRALSTIQQQYDDLQLEITTKKERRKSIKLNRINSQNSLIVKTDSEISDSTSSTSSTSNNNTNGTPPPIKRTSSKSPFSSDEIKQLEKDFIQLQEKLQLERQHLTDAEQIIKTKNSEIQQLQHQILSFSTKKNTDILVVAGNINNDNTTIATTSTTSSDNNNHLSTNNSEVDKLIETLKLEKNKIYSLYNVQLKENQKLQLEVEELRSQLEIDASLRDIPLFSPLRPAYTYYDPLAPVPTLAASTTTAVIQDTSTILSADTINNNNQNNNNNNIYQERDKLFRENKKLKDTIQQLQHENDKLQSNPLTSSCSFSQFRNCSPNSSFQSSFSISSFSTNTLLPTTISSVSDHTTTTTITMAALTKENQKLKVQLLNKQKELQHIRNDVRKSEAIRYRVKLREISTQILQLEIQLQVLDTNTIIGNTSTDPSDNIFSEEDSNNSSTSNTTTTTTTSSDNIKAIEGGHITKIFELVKNIKESIENLLTNHNHDNNNNNNNNNNSEKPPPPPPPRHGHNSNNSSQDSISSTISSINNNNSPTTSPLLSTDPHTSLVNNTIPNSLTSLTSSTTSTTSLTNKIKARSFSSAAIKSEKIKYLQTSFMNQNNNNSYNYNYSKEYNRAYPTTTTTVSSNKNNNTYNSNNNNNANNNNSNSNKSTADVTTNTEDDYNSTNSTNNNSPTKSLLLKQQQQQQEVDENRRLKTEMNQLSQNLHHLIIKEILYQNNNNNNTTTTTTTTTTNNNLPRVELSVTRGCYLTKLKQFTQIIDTIITPGRTMAND